MTKKIELIGDGGRRMVMGGREEKNWGRKVMEEGRKGEDGRKREGR